MPRPAKPSTRPADAVTVTAPGALAAAAAAAGLWVDDAWSARETRGTLYGVQSPRVPFEEWRDQLMATIRNDGEGARPGVMRLRLERYGPRDPREAVEFEVYADEWDGLVLLLCTLVARAHADGTIPPLPSASADTPTGEGATHA